MGWVKLLFVLVVVRQASSGSSLGTLVGASLGVIGVSPQLWEPEPWEPERRSKSLAFLGRDEEIVDNNSISNNDDNDDKHKDKDVEDGKSDKKAILNVSDKDSPYALIDKYFPERESYFYQNRNKFLTEYRNSGGAEEKFNDIGDLDPSEVWLADDSLLVLKGGSTPDRDGYDNPWRPIDDFQAPYREPVLPPPDFDPDTLDIGVGVPIEKILAERARTERVTPPSTNHKPVFVSHNQLTNPRHLPPPIENSLALERNSIQTPDPLKPFKDEVEAGHEEFKQFLDDVSKFISDMENFHSVKKKQSASKTLVRTLPPPPPPSPSTTSSPSSPYPISYTSPHGKVFLSTNYVTHPPPSPSSPSPISTISPSLQPHRQQARSTLYPPKTSPSPTTISTPSSTLPQRTYTISPAYRERRTTTSSTTTSTTTPKPPVKSFNNQQDDWTPVTTPPTIIRKYNREDEFKSVVKQLPPRVTPAPIRHSIKPSDKPSLTTPSYHLISPAPTPYSLFQSIPENFQETDVFHLSQNVDFGKKLGVGSPIDHRPLKHATPANRRPPPPPPPPQHSVAYNEVDTGIPHSQLKGRYSVSVTTKPPAHKHQRQRSGGVSLDSLLPAIFTGARERSRSTLVHRRRRPKFISAPVQPQASDRQGQGDVRYVSFFSGGAGGNSWGYSYNLGK